MESTVTLKLSEYDELSNIKKEFEKLQESILNEDLQFKYSNEVIISRSNFTSKLYTNDKLLNTAKTRLREMTETNESLEKKCQSMQIEIEELEQTILRYRFEHRKKWFRSC